MTDAQCIAIWGRRGSGKSSRVRELLKAGGRRRVVVFDPMDEYAAQGFDRAADYGQLVRLMRDQWAGDFRIAFVPRGGFEPRALHDVVAILWQAQMPYLDGRDRRQLTLVVEEMDLSFPAEGLPADCRSMHDAVNRGRHMGLEVIGVSQRPAAVSKHFRANVSTAYCFAMGDPDDARAAARVLGGGPELGRQLGDLADHHFLFRAGGTGYQAGKNRLAA